MTLHIYLTENPNAPTLTDLSEMLGVTKGRVSQLRYSMHWPPELALKLEEVTNGAMDASSISPVVALARSTKDGRKSK